MTEKRFLQCAELRLARRDLPAAIVAFDRAEFGGASADCCAGGRWLAHMLAGNFTAAWAESDAIRRRGAPDPHRFWAGEDLRGRRVILRCLHGYGDAVQFLRYAPRVSELAAHLLVEVPPAMMEIASCFAGVDNVTTWTEEVRNWDVQVEIMELPYLFRTEAHELPLAEHYLHLPPEIERRVKGMMGFSNSPRVGIVWAAGDWDRSRSLSFGLLEPLLRCSPCEFWNLQGGHARAECSGGRGEPQLRDAACCGEGILALAATIAQMDLVITVDTLAAHLAGALGTPAWLLLQYAADWRWMTGRSDSPWYPSLRLYRQPAQGDWESTIRTVTEDLTRWLASQRDPRAAA
jgi:hypothetical protein